MRSYNENFYLKLSFFMNELDEDIAVIGGAIFIDVYNFIFIILTSSFHNCHSYWVIDQLIYQKYRMVD